MALKDQGPIITNSNIQQDSTMEIKIFCIDRLKI